jgi:uncharacterized protein
MGEFVITTSTKTTYTKNTPTNTSTNEIKNHYYFHLEDERGHTILLSEAFSSKGACENGIVMVKENVLDDTKYENKVSAKKKFYFNLLNCEGIPIGSSKMYDTIEGYAEAILSVKSNAPKAKIVEEI